MLVEILCSAAAYIIGSVNFSIIIPQLYLKQDPRHYGSRNAGTTNVYRQSGVVMAATVLSLDIGRAALTGLAAHYIIPDQHISLASLGLILGNRYPCFHNFAGGKGVANYLGFTISISPFTSLASISVWGLIFFVFRVPFVASFGMVLVLCTGTVLTLGNNTITILEALSTAILIVLFHKRNILQLIGKDRKTPYDSNKTTTVIRN